MGPSTRLPCYREALVGARGQQRLTANTARSSRLNAQVSRLCRVRTLQRLGVAGFPFGRRTREGPPP